jgi:hypothetical protein
VVYLQGKGQAATNPQVIRNIILKAYCTEIDFVPGDHRYLHPYAKKHSEVSWFSCVHDQCDLHLQEKIANKWFPQKNEGRPVGQPYTRRQLEEWVIIKKFTPTEAILQNATPSRDDRPMPEQLETSQEERDASYYLPGVGDGQGASQMLMDYMMIAPEGINLNAASNLFSYLIKQGQTGPVNEELLIRTRQRVGDDATPQEYVNEYIRQAKMTKEEQAYSDAPFLRQIDDATAFTEQYIKSTERKGAYVTTYNLFFRAMRVYNISPANHGWIKETRRNSTKSTKVGEFLEEYQRLARKGGIRHPKNKHRRR